MPSSNRDNYKDKSPLHMSVFWFGFDQAGLSARDLVELASRMPGGEKAIVDKAFYLKVQ